LQLVKTGKLAKNWPSIPRLRVLQVPDFANTSSRQAAFEAQPVEAHKLCLADTLVDFKFVMESVLKAVTHERIAIIRVGLAWVARLFSKRRAGRDLPAVLRNRILEC
jgi:hypothetical protein